MNKIVALNSGGFDSICLMYYLKENFPDTEVVTLFFNYGQNSYAKEKECAEKICKKLGYEFNEIVLPKFNWSKSGLVSDGTSPYLEMRNLIFLSYAVSVSQSLQTKDIFIAFIKPQSYPDTSFEFLARMNTLVSDLGIHIHAPFHQLEKEELNPYIRRNLITRNDFCSCLGTEENTGVACSNCDYFDYLYSEVISPNLFDDLYACGDLDSLYRLGECKPITNAKLFINDVCNMKCGYCLTQGTFPSECDSRPENWAKVINHLYSLGITNIDFTGKEPFIDSTIFSIINLLCPEVRKALKFSAITNGKNLTKFRDYITQGVISQITLSDDGNVERDTDIIPLINEFKDIVDLSISFDLHSLNKDNCISHIQKLLQLGVSVYVKPILSYKGMFKEYELSCPDFYWVIEKLCDSLTLEEKQKLTISVPYQYSEISDKIFMSTDLNDNTYRGISFSLDLYCIAGFDTVFVYSDGTFSGCGNAIFTNSCSRSQNILDVNNSEDLKTSVVSRGQRVCCVKK